MRNKKEFSDLNNKFITFNQIELTVDEDFIIKDSKNSKIFIETIVGAIYIKNLENCEISCAPVTGSIFIQNCKNCKFQLASKQVWKKKKNF